MTSQRSVRFSRFFVAPVLALGCLSLGAGAASAASGPPSLPGPSQPSIQPVSPTPSNNYWDLSAKPGQSIQLTAEVRNGGDKSATFQLGSTGAGTGSTTGIGYTLGHGSTASWVTGLPATVTLAPHKAELVHATLTVPQDASVPYQYVGGLEALGQASTPNAHKGTVSIAQRDAAVVAWVVSTGTPETNGIRFGTPVMKASAAPELNFPATNVGQGLYAPKVGLSVYSGACTASGGTGKALVSVDRQWALTVPGTSWDYPVLLASVLPTGTYCAAEQTVPGTPSYATFSVTPQQQKTESSTPAIAKVTQPASHSSGSGLLVVVIVLGLVIIALLLVLVLRSRKNGAVKP